ncbi:MAG: hypothetical protein K1X63_11900 [Chitinophagales bacterium]|nr:hypothetical protein [Chitinophagales bacterium]
MSGFRMRLLVEFREIFEKSEEKSLKEFLDGISRSTILNVGAFFLGFSNNESKYDDYREFLSMFFGKENEKFANEVFKKCQALEKRTSRQLLIVNPISSLRLFEFAFENIEDKDTQTEAEAEVNLFKAYLLINQQSTESDKHAGESTANVEHGIQVPALTLTMSFSYADIINYDISEVLVTQLIKAIYLLEFLSEHEKGKIILKGLLDQFECPSWQEYLKSFMPLAMAVANQEREAHIDIDVTHDDSYEKSCSFIDRLIVIDNESIKDYDFKIIRAKPLYKLSEGKYRIIYPLFVIEKIFKGLYFFLSAINNALPATARISEFKSFIGDEFSEKVLLYRTLNYIFSGKYLTKTGEEMKELGIDAEPDYYARRSDNIILFEAKDVLIRADLKLSKDFAIYETEFKKKFYFDERNGRVHKKAILQLISHIKVVLTDHFPFDKDYHYRSVHIYPVLVVFDRTFNVAGLHQLLNKWFSNELNQLKDEGLFINRVKPLVLVDIDTLIFHQDLFKQKIMSLEDLIDEYVKLMSIAPLQKFKSQRHAEDRVEQTLLPFSVFVHRYVGEKKIRKVPEIFLEFGYKLA